MKRADYLLEALKYHGGRADGYLTDVPRPTIQLADDDYNRVRYDATAMRWIANRPSRIKYPTARELIKQYRCRRLVEAQRAMRSTTPSTSPREYAERLG